MSFDIEIKGATPLYKQIVDYFERECISGKLQPGNGIPSMNELAATLNISRETIKKAYGVLCQRGILEARHGKGFFIAKRDKVAGLRVAMMVDSISSYRQIFINEFSAAMGDKTDINIMLHNQSVEMLRYFIDKVLGKFDYYIVTPHFPQNAKNHAEVLKQLSRIPNRQLILADNLQDGLQGNFGAVYQDYGRDAAIALESAVNILCTYPCIDVFRMTNSLYGDKIQQALKDFSAKHKIRMRFHKEVTPEKIHANQLCLLLNSSADAVLFDLNKIAHEKGLRIGENLKVISYNDSPICELIFGGLSTLSTDFSQMGRLCAQMIHSGEMSKLKCDFRLIRRNSF